jgi:single-stranded-DNA-specific exonuclease
MGGSSQETEWIVKEIPDGFRGEDAVGGLPRILRLLLAQRGHLEPEEIERFLRPRLADLADPFELPDMEVAVERIFKAIDAGEAICIFGDYDVDGITSITILRHALRLYGAEPRSFIPIRGTEGYGLSEPAVERCLTESTRPSLLIAVDCGTASRDQIAKLQADGIDVIVADHHEPGEAGRPPGVAVVNPKLGDDFGYLCSAGVVFKLVHALLKTREIEGADPRELLKETLDLVAVGTIADIVPLVDENRLLVRHGLRRLPESKNHGLQALMKVTGMNGRATSSDVGFRIGPRINAAGRMDMPADGLAVLLAESPAEAETRADLLDEYNRRRQKCELQMYEEAMTQLTEHHDPENDAAIVVASRNWHPGVVGIVASRLMRAYYKPSFVVAIDDDGLGKGSGRSIEGVSLVNAIDAGRELLVAGGGHHMAAGISIMEDQMDAFRDRFRKFVLETTSDEQRKPRLHIDAVVPFGDLSLEFLASYELLQPFGASNPQPVFLARDVWLTERPRRLKNKHLKLFLRQGVVEHDAMFFGAGDRDLPDPPWDLAFTIDRNVFRGRTSLQMTVREVRASR